MSAVVDPPLLQIEGLATEFKGEKTPVRVVKGVDLRVQAGDTVAIVGESGSGKSVTGLSIMRLIRPAIGGIAEGKILFRSRAGEVIDLACASERVMQAIRGNEISMIFQEPMTSLNPVQTVGRQIAEVVELHEAASAGVAWRRAIDMLALVEIPDPAARAKAYPHQMSGGMRQRVMIAMALVCRPALLIADEPTTALDVTVQLQILRLIRALQREIGMGVLFITHNLGVVAEIADRVEVMYGGRIVESAAVLDLFDGPRHPYTRGLLASAPRAGGFGAARSRLAAIPGQVVDPRRPPPGCEFGPRCALAQDACRRAPPPMAMVSAEQSSRCLRWRELA